MSQDPEIAVIRKVRKILAPLPKSVRLLALAYLLHEETRREVSWVYEAAKAAAREELRSQQPTKGER